MKKIFTYLFLTLICEINIAQVVPNIDWIRNYSDRNSLENVPAAIDASNNVVITGYTTVAGSEDFTTVKYDASGVQLWVAHYNNGGSDRANAIAIDNADNVYVLGQSMGVGTGLDYALVKYNSSGIQQWVVRYNGTGNGDDIPLALIIDNTGSGAIYVTGKSKGISSDFDYATIKYNTSGVQQWVHLYNGSGNAADEGIALALGTGNRLFVTGTAKSNTTGLDITTIRLNSNTGSMNWVNVKNGTANSTDQSFSLVLDGTNVVVAGKINNTSTGDDYSVHKINGNTGVNIWSFNYDGFGGNDLASSVVRDITGNFLVTGVVPTTAGITEYHTIKLNNSGVQQWVNKESTSLLGYNIVPKITVDLLSHMYVLGQVKNVAGNSDVYIYQVTPTGGNTTWKKTHNGAANGTDAGVDFLVNNIGQIYIAAQTKNSFAKWDYTTIKISQTPVVFPPDLLGETNDKTLLFYENNGQLINTNNLQIPDIKYYSRSHSPAMYWNNNEVSFVFSQTDTIPTDDDTLHRIDLTFNQSNPYSEIFPYEQGEGYLNYYNHLIASGVTNVKGFQRLMIPNIYSNIDLHYYTNQDGLKYYFVIKPGGDPSAIAEFFDGATSSNINGIGDLEINSEIGQLVLTNPIAYQVLPSLTMVSLGNAPYVNTGLNSYKFNVPTYNPLLPLIIVVNEPQRSYSSITPLENICWSTYFGGESRDAFYGIDLDNNGNQYAVGQSSSEFFPVTPGLLISSNPLNITYATLTKFNPDHSLNFSTFFGGSYITSGWDVKVKNNNEIIIVGYTLDDDLPVQNLTGAYYNPTPTVSIYKDGFIARFDASGFRTWATYFQGDSDDEAFGVDFDNLGNMYVVGYAGGAGFPLKTLGGAWNQVADGIYYDGYISRFNNSYFQTWCTYYSGTKTDKIVSLCIDNNNNVYVAGLTRSLDLFTNGTGYVINTFNGGSNDGFIAKFNPSGVKTWATYIGGDNLDVFEGPSWSEHVLAVDNNYLYFTGTTSSTNFPLQTSGSSYYNSSYTSNYDGYLMKFDRLNNSLLWSTLLTSTGTNYLHSIDVDGKGNCFVAGTTTDNTFPLVNAPGNYYQNTISGGGFYAEAIMIHFDASNQMKWSTFVGGNNSTGQEEIFHDIYIDNNNLYAVGTTCADDISGLLNYPVFDPGVAGNYFDGNYNGGLHDAAITKFCVGNLIGVEEIFYDENVGFSVYPNPASETVLVELTTFEKGINLVIYDALGQQIKCIDIETNKFSLNITDFSRGLYYFVIKREFETIGTYKLAVK
jgi:hypothetical protein